MSDGLTFLLSILVFWQGAMLVATLGMWFADDIAPWDEDAIARWSPIGLPIWGIVVLVTYPVRRRERRARQVESDYRETLALIEWKPKPRTAVDDVLDALEEEGAS